MPDPSAADAARDIMLHRGPDDSGSFRAPGVWLGSRRLAIIDIGPAGHQPFSDRETGVTVAFNGEIYNYVEVRAELESHGHRFATRSDTEVLLRSYIHWGPSCLERLNGMWAFIVWDPREQKAFFSRDRFGVKPLFITRLPEGVALASEPKVLLALFPRLREADDVSLYRLLGEKRIYSGAESFYRSIKVVPAAHYGFYRPGDTSATLRRYWQFPPQEEHAALTWAEARDGFGPLLQDAVRLRLRSDVPLGLTLSGGLDSTAIADSARRGLPDDSPLVAYTSVYEEAAGVERTDELGWAQLALSRHTNTILRPVAAIEDNWLETLRQIVWHMDGPGFSPAVFPLWNIAMRARSDGVKVLLEGQGADELLGGYAWHTAAALLDDGRRIATGDGGALGSLLHAVREVPGHFSWRRVGGDVAAQLIPELRRWDRRRGTLFTALRPELVAAGRDGEHDRLPLAGRDRLGRLLLTDFARDLLPGFLHYGDAVTMAHSVENRLPFMDYRLVELCFRMPGDYKIRAGESKAPLRVHLRRIGELQIAARARKQGYPTPANRWLAADGGRTLKELLLDRDARVRNYVLPGPLAHMIDHHASGSFAAGDSLFALVCTELWLQGGHATSRTASSS
jgi:asparagine synthase (glutamine-hydrolysing)